MAGLRQIVIQMLILYQNNSIYFLNTKSQNLQSTLNYVQCKSPRVLSDAQVRVRILLQVA